MIVYFCLILFSDANLLIFFQFLAPFFKKVA